MKSLKNHIRNATYGIITAIFLVTSCKPVNTSLDLPQTSPGEEVEDANPTSVPTTLPTRKTYAPGELVNYTAQSGDYLSALALRFNTSVGEIMEANPQIPQDATTMPPGMPMKIPIYYLALWGTPYQALPDHAFVYGPSSTGFNTAAYVQSQPGWLGDYRAYVGGKWRSGAEMVDYIAMNYSINPRLLLALLEYQSGALSNPEKPDTKRILNLTRRFWDTPYLQLVLTANLLNNGYYGWRSGSLLEFEDTDGRLIRPDPWQNAGTVALQFFYANIFNGQEYARAVSPEGFAQTYNDLFGDPWNEKTIQIPGSLQQPEFQLPYQVDQIWLYTGGPHTGWGTGEPRAAIDFAPPSEKSGCVTAKPENYVTAMADGLVVRSGVDGLALDLDKDGNEKTGWVIFYLHLAPDQQAPLGTELRAGDKIGYPSCAGGHATGTHVHIARKFNGEWILADSAVPLEMSGWITHNGEKEYLGTLTKGSLTVTACDCGDIDSAVRGSTP